MPEVDTKLAAALRQAKAAPMNFAFVAKGASEGKLLVSKLPIPTKQVTQAKAELGGGLIFKGRCFGEEGRMVFEVPKEPPATLANQIKKIISRDAGLTLHVEVRVNQGLAEEETAPSQAEEEAPKPAATVPPSAATPGADVRAQLLQRLRTLTPNYQAAVARKGPEGSLLHKLLEAFQAALGKQSFALAAKALTELEGLVAKALAAPTATPQAPGSPGAETWQKRLAALTPSLKQVLATNGPSVPQIKQLFAQASALAQKKDYAAACAALDPLEALIKQALAGAPPASQPAASAAQVSAAVAAELARPAVVAQLAAKAGKVVPARPKAPPRAALTNDLLKAVVEKSPPEQVQDVPGHVAELVPQFLMTVASELSQTSQRLETGAALPAQDQMLAVADSLNAALRSMKKWEDFLERAESAGKRLDQLEKAKQGGDEQAEAEFEEVLEGYNTARAGGLAEQANTLKLAQALLTEYKGLQAAQPRA